MSPAITTFMNKRLLYVSCFIIISITILSQCISKSPSDLRGEQFAGAHTCITCHKTICDSYLTTAHHNTSSPGNIKGNFPDTFTFSNGEKILITQKDSNYYQGNHRFDVTIGSGRKAQSFLYLENGKYFQLPLSYFVAAGSWANSPGFPPDHPKFDRIIPSTCFGCHSSKAGVAETKMEGRRITETFRKDQLLYGIDCERCHGPAAAHVAYQTKHPGEKEAKYMTKIASLSNLQQLDMCALCHSGLKTPQRSVFDFRPGDALADYIYPDITSPKKPSELDVHGTQSQLFAASKCYIKSTGMNCVSCHDPHNSRKVSTQRCISCHATTTHKTFTLSSGKLEENCVNCHMPALPSDKITLLTNGEVSPTSDLINTHLITVYEEETKKILKLLK